MPSVPIVRYNGPSKRNSWARWMVARTMRKNDNNLISVIGKTGSGKTWSAISICEIMSKMDKVPFTSKNIVFSLKELMDLINSGVLKRGSKIIFDEPQVSISAREFQSMANKVFNLLVTTFRHLNLSLFFCTPFESLLDKSTRKLLHARFETMSINTRKKTCRLKPRYIEYSDWKSMPYLKQLIIYDKTPDGSKRVQKMFHWDVPMPSDKIIKEYEKKKTDFTSNLNKNISSQLSKFDESGKSMTAPQQVAVVGVRKELTEKQLRAMEFLAAYGLKETAKRLGVTMGAISIHKKLSMKKGWGLQEFKDNRASQTQNP